MSDSRNSINFNLKSLVVDDNIVHQNLSSHILKSLGCDVDTASDGKEGWEKFEINEYDIVFMDLNMPVMDGYEAIKKIREIMSKRAHKSKIITITSNSTQADKVLCNKIGVDHYITKPMKTENIKDVLEILFPRSK